jgi:hypothetical protein
VHHRESPIKAYPRGIKRLGKASGRLSVLETEKRKNNIYHFLKGLLESSWRLLMSFNGNLRGQKYRVIFLPIRKGFKIFEGAYMEV